MKTTPNGMRYLLARDGIVHKEAMEIIADLDNQLAELRSAVDCACNALTASIRTSGNDADSNMCWVSRLRRHISHSTKD